MPHARKKFLRKHKLCPAKFIKLGSYIRHTFNIHKFLAVAYVVRTEVELVSQRLIVFPAQSEQGCQDRFMCKVKKKIM